MKMHGISKLAAASLIAAVLAGPGMVLGQEKAETPVQWKPPQQGELEGVKVQRPSDMINSTSTPTDPETPASFQGSLKFDQLKFDYATVEEGKVVEAIFTFTNTSDTTVTISSVRSSCGCTAVAPDKKEYLPGETGTIKADFNTSSRTGRQIKHITVNTDEAPNANYVLELAGMVVTQVYMEPKMIDFGGVRADEETSITLHFVNMTGSPINIVKMESSRNDMNVAHGDPAEYREKGTGRVGIATPIVVTLPKGMRQGSINGTLNVTTDVASGQKQHNVIVRGKVLGEISIEPEEAYFGVGKPGDILTKSVKVRLLSQQPFHMNNFDVVVAPPPNTTTTVEKPEVAIEVGEMQEGEQLVTMTMTVPNAIGRISGAVHMNGQAGDKTISDLAIPFMVYVNAPRNTRSSEAPAGQSSTKAGATTHNGHNESNLSQHTSLNSKAPAKE